MTKRTSPQKPPFLWGPPGVGAVSRPLPHLPWRCVQYRWVLFFGAVCKAFYGPGWVIKLQWALEYFYTHDVR